MSVLIAGAARGGTSWLGDLAAGLLRSRLLFEPFAVSQKVKGRHG